MINGQYSDDVGNQQKIIEYFFSSQNIQLIESHEQETIGDTILIVNPNEKKNDVCKHQIIKFNFSRKTDDILSATAVYAYDNGTKDGMIFNNEFFIEKMKLGQKCISVLDKIPVKHYYPAMGFNIEMNTVENKIVLKECYQRINIIGTHGTSYHLLEKLVNDFICTNLKSWEINTHDIELTDLIDMFLMVDI
jgi:hypothetical protein